MKFRLLFASLLLAVCAPLNASEAIFKKWDKNEDGFLSREEVPEGPRRIFENKDANSDGKISLAEHLGRAPQKGEMEKGKGNHKGGNQSSEDQPPADGAAFTIKQTWPQEPDGFDRPVFVSEPGQRSEKTPVIFYFHGNGGAASGSIRQWSKTFPNHLVVAPQGYSRSWNISGERSQAPDVSFFRTLHEEIGKRYPYADMEDVILIGSSNGGGYIYRLMIEIEENLFHTAIPTVASLLVAEYHDASFWKSKDESDTASLDMKATPRSDSKLRILYVHGTDDKVVPFHGGLRGRQFKHLSAYETANILAAHHGYQGKPQTATDGKKIGDSLVHHQFEGTGVEFLAVTGGSHGLQPHRDEAIAFIQKFVSERK